MIPTPKELEADMEKLKTMVICAAVIAFGAGFIAGAVLI
jgi:hypothetical protein